jgi:hypothetical protein
MPNGSSVARGCTLGRALVEKVKAIPLGMHGPRFSVVRAGDVGQDEPGPQCRSKSVRPPLLSG